MNLIPDGLPHGSYGDAFSPEQRGRGKARAGTPAHGKRRHKVAGPLKRAGCNAAQDRRGGDRYRNAGTGRCTSYHGLLARIAAAGGLES
jgi:hypothetical protein